jgi:hypothetical protein
MEDWIFDAAKDFRAESALSTEAFMAQFSQNA